MSYLLIGSMQHFIYVEISSDNKMIILKNGSVFCTGTGSLYGENCFSYASLNTQPEKKDTDWNILIWIENFSLELWYFK